MRWNQTPYEGRFPLNLDYDEIKEERLYPEGSIIVDMNQRTSRVIAYLLEPKADGSLVYWGFFNAIFKARGFLFYSRGYDSLIKLNAF